MSFLRVSKTLVGQGFSTRKKGNTHAPIFVMSWCDYQRRQYWYNNKQHFINKNGKVFPNSLKSKILFCLNIWGGQWVTMSDIIDFVYSDYHPDNIPLCVNGNIRSWVCHLRKILPQGVIIIGSQSFGYQLKIENETDYCKID